MADIKPRLRVPKTAKKGEIIEIKTLVNHVMESGQRKDAEGKPIPRKIINRFTCELNGKLVCEMTLHPAISANPYIAFFLKAEESGTLTFTWYDDDGSVTKVESKLEVTA